MVFPITLATGSVFDWLLSKFCLTSNAKSVPKGNRNFPERFHRDKIAQARKLGAYVSKYRFSGVIDFQLVVISYTFHASQSQTSIQFYKPNQSSISIEKRTQPMTKLLASVPQNSLS